MNNVHNQNFNNMNDQVNLSRQFTSYHVKAEPNPFYNQNGFSNTFTHQLYQQPFVHQRTHLPIQFEELYNTNSLQNRRFYLFNSPLKSSNLISSSSTLNMRRTVSAPL